jgi:carbon-monoxide dehydrogenase medium subunit
MKPATFRYHAPATLPDALALLSEYGDDAKVLAGGQSLVPILAMRLSRFDHLVDVNRVDGLAGITRENGHLVVRAGTRQRALERDESVAAHVPLLARAAPLIAHFQIRNRGTVGGSLAHADPASELPAVALALGAEFDIASERGTRRADAATFFESLWTTTLEPDELLVGARFPVWSGRSGFGIREVARRHGDFAIAGAVCALAADDDGRLARAAIALFGVASTPRRAADAEAALTGAIATDVDAMEVAAAAVRGLDPTDDVHASGAARLAIAQHVVSLALSDALAEVRDAR